MKPTHTLREEHDELMHKIQEFEEVLDTLPTLPQQDLEQVIRRQVNFLQKEIKTHAAAEEKYLYAEIDYLCGHCRDVGVKTSATMEIDHEYIAAYIERLADMAPAISSQTLADFQRAGWELVAILKLHFDKEERVFLALLDSRFTEEEIEKRIVRRMEQYEKGTPVARPSEEELIAFG
jgi:hemerythrin-like domain-containing protein